MKGEFAFEKKNSGRIEDRCEKIAGGKNEMVGGSVTFHVRRAVTRKAKTVVDCERNDRYFELPS
jgi:hypothetical protein